MSELLYGYQKIDPTTWAYLSSLLMIGLYFKFSRFWSVRNLDLVLLILLAPGLLLVHRGQEMRQAAAHVQAEEVAAAPKTAATKPPTAAVDTSPEKVELRDPNPMDPLGLDPTDSERATLSVAEATAARGVRSERWGYLFLFVAGGLLLVRLLADPTMVRRPLLEPNLSPGGLTFVGVSLFIFLFANVAANPPTPTQWPSNAPGFRLIQGLPEIRTGQVSRPADLPAPALPVQDEELNAAVTKAIVIIAHLAIVLAVIGIGWRHFDNMKMGVGAATLYLMLPYTAQMTGSAYHAVPAALLLWAVLCYRRPLTAGIFMGLAIGVCYYPVYLLPLWLSFYWPRGLMRFIGGVLLSVALMAVVLLFRVESGSQYVYELQAMLGALPFRMKDLSGIWGLGWDPWYRVPMLAAFVVLAGSFALWPAQKNLGTLLSCSAAVMLATQFWHGDGGGLYMSWYLPLLLLTIFRPNLEDRVALSVLGEGWFPRRRHGGNQSLERAA
jgi:hypothetical protein